MSAALTEILDRAKQGILSVVGEDVQPQACGNLLTYIDAPDTVAVLVETGREDADTPLSRNDRKDAAAHTALGRDAYLIGPLPGEVIHPTRVHNAQNISDVAAGERLLSGYGVHAPVGQRRRHHREIPRGYADRALPQVECEVLFDVLANHTVAAHQVGCRAVPIRRSQLRGESTLVHLQSLVPGVASESVQYECILLRSVPALYEVGRHERPRINHRIVWTVVPLVENNGVERVATRLHPHSLQNVVASAGFQSQAVDEHLRDGLEGEWPVVVASVVDLAVRCRKADGKQLLLGFCDFRCVIADTRFVVANDRVIL